MWYMYRCAIPYIYNGAVWYIYNGVFKNKGENYGFYNKIGSGYY